MSGLKLSSRAFPFVIGTTCAAMAFAFLSFDLKYHWVPYSGPPSHLQKFYPWIISLAVMGCSTIVPWLRRQRARSWPSVQAHVESGSIGPSPQNAGESMLTVGYSYSVYGDRYGGVYTASFRSEATAEALLQRLKTVPPTVRYKPGYPWDSILDPYNFGS